MTKKNQFLSVMGALAEWIGYALIYLRTHIFPQGLLHRFILIILLPLILLEAVIIIFFYDRHWDVIARRLALDVTGEIGLIADIIQQKPSPDTVENLLRDMQKNLSLKMVFLPHQTLEKDTHVSHKNPVYLYHALQELGYPFLLHENTDRSVLVSTQLNNGVLQTLVPKKRHFTSTILVFLIWLVGSAVLLFWIAFLFMKNQVRSIERLSQASELLGRS
ncbi:MAG: hypothetical protein ACI4QM_02895, partial [Alphaproteobacteria bacterium]